MRAKPGFAAGIILGVTAAALAGQVRISYVSELAYDQPQAGVYLKNAAGTYLPVGTEGYILPGLLDTGAAASVLPKYLQDEMLTQLDPTGTAEILTLCGYSEFLDLSQKVYIGIGPVESDNESDFVEIGPQRIAVRRSDPPGADLLGFPMIVGTPFLRDHSVRVEWQMIEVWPGIELPQLISTPRLASVPSGPTDLTLPLTMAGDTNYDPDLAIPTAHSVPFADVVLRNGANRQRRQFIIDTGAQISFISTELALAMGIDLANPVDTGLPVIGAGTCDVTIYPYYVDEMILPSRQKVSLVFEQPMVYVMDVPGIDGGIGSNMLFFFDELDAADIDLAGQNLGIKLNVPIPPAGDLTGDGKVNVVDLLTLADSYRTTPSYPAYNERADIDDDGIIGITELHQVAADFGKTTP